MKKVRLNLGNRSYDILVGAGGFKRLPGLIGEGGFSGPVVVVTDKTVASRAARIINPVLKRISNELFLLTVPGTERSKSLEIFRDTIHKISKKTKTYLPMIVALGGGVVGDLAGFVAATYRRGVPLIQVPTTLLAQVDSSVGGKVGIDLPEAKNLMGAFYQPKAVLTDTDFLSTLPRRQIRNGMAEVIKYAVIGRIDLFEYLEKHMWAILALEKSALERVIYECVSIKARVVEEDEHDDRGIRIALNFGHTLGHAIESASGYSRQYNHGESIAIGMVLAGEIAVRLGMFKEEEFKRMKDLIRKAGLPVRVKGVPVKEIMDSQKYDKKFITGASRLVLPKKIGSVEVVEDIPGLLIKTVLKKYAG